VTLGIYFRIYFLISNFWVIRGLSSDLQLMEDIENNDTPFKSFVREYFRAVIAAAPENLVIGDKMTFGMRFMDKDGNWGPIIGKTTVTREELKNE
jgi:hypothetical protein